MSEFSTADNARRVLQSDEIPTSDQVTDSNPHAVKYFGRVRLKSTSFTSPPAGEDCVGVIRKLKYKTSRQKYRHGCSKWLELIVSCRTGHLICNGIDLQSGNSQQPDLPGLLIPLFKIASAADFDTCFCIILMDWPIDSPTIVYHAHVFEVCTPCKDGFRSKHHLDLYCSPVSFWFS
eukprot:m.31300 g.31300  ORF g.31300 m.31300 type:complete len:177 (-) comp9403_c0_seq1:871-1401(-)